VTDEDLQAAGVLANRARFPKMDGAHDRAALELARDYVPRLLAEVRRLRAEVAHEREKTRAACEQNDAHFAQGYGVAIEEAAAVCEAYAERARGAAEAHRVSGSYDPNVYAHEVEAAEWCVEELRALAAKERP